MGKSFGSRDSSATNDMLNGQVVATGTPGSKTVSDPNQGLSDQQMRVRQLFAGGLGQFGKSVQQQYGQQPQQSGGAPPIVPAQQPQVDMSAAMPQYFQNPMQRRSPSQQFFGGY
jgi:hypothetical protein